MSDDGIGMIKGLVWLIIAAIILFSVIGTIDTQFETYFGGSDGNYTTTDGNKSFYQVAEFMPPIAGIIMGVGFIVLLARTMN